jgi:long-chain-fatty-acid--[acyl-carrier-protein] ligase
MANVIKKTLILILRFLLSLRYRIEVVGLDDVRGLKRALVLPNHPAFIDPALVLGQVWPVLQPRPMLFAPIFDNPLFFWIPKALDALKVPDLDQQSMAAREQTQQTIDAVVEGLERGDNFMLWPSGSVQRKDREILGSTRSVSEIVSRVSDVTLVLVRTRGVRGSIFSFARTGAAPNLTACLLKGIGILLANLIFLTPRRRVEITVEKVSRDSLPGLSREELNPWLETWYNAPGIEPPTHVPYHVFFGSRTFDFPDPRAALAERATGKIKPATKAAVDEILEQKLGGASDAVHEAGTGLDALGLDSLDRMEISLAIEERFGFRSDGVSETVGDLWVLAEGLTESAPPKPPSSSWFKSPPRDVPAEVLGETILEALVQRATACGREVVAADDLSGILTYERLLVGVQAIGQRLEEMIAATNVGVLMPASVATDIVVFAIHFAGKTPVLLNWTTGPGNLTHAAQTMGLTHIVTSKRFIDRVAIEVEDTSYVHLEELRKGIGKLELLWLLLRTRFAPGALMRRLPSASPTDPAVVLFTSGSEKAPKAVPLTHANILGNLRSVIEGYDLRRTDIILGFLPAFHSFGITVTTMLPIISGCRVVHHPDPTDASALARKLAAYRATIVCATPTFLGNILNHTKSEDLVSLRWAIVGAEKCPDALFDTFESLAPDADLLEGYGITECSPLVCCNLPGGRAKRGSIGVPIPNVELRIVDPDSFEPLPDDKVGMLLVCGPNVFPGYIGDDVPCPFLELDGKRWYVTGDLASVDEDGYYYFSGRLKRFLKAGGEMISLPAIEEPLSLKYPPTEEGPRVAVEGVESDSGRHIVLFTTEDITLRDANALLMEGGFRGVMRLDEVRRVKTIPALGTGKTDYKVMRAWLTHG